MAINYAGIEIHRDKEKSGINATDIRLHQSYYCYYSNKQ